MKKEDVNVAAEFIELIETGIYKKLKDTETFLKQAKEELRGNLESYEGKRHEFKALNMVAKFVPKNQWETNHAGMIDELLCYVHPEIAFSVIRLDAKRIKEDCISDLLKPYLLPSTYYVRPTLNKKGKNVIGKIDYFFGGQSLEELVAEIKMTNLEHKKYQELYDEFKRKALDCTTLQEQRKVSTPYGSISLLPNKPEWDIAKINDTLGEEFLLTYGKVDMVRIDDLILQGIIPKTVVSAHRVLKDIRLDFVVMDISSEEKALNFHRRKQISSSLKRFA